MLDFDIFRLKLERNIVMSEIIIIKFFKLQNLSEKQKCLNFEPKMPFLGIFHQKCLFWVFFTKNALFGYFWSRISKMRMSYLKSAP